jgi:hypothetical protein
LPQDAEIKIWTAENRLKNGKLAKHNIAMRPTDEKV